MTRQVSPTRLLTAAVLLGVVRTASAHGQEPAVDVESIRQVLLDGFEIHRAMDVAYVRAVPDSALRWAPTPGVRDYAQQIEHIVLDNPNIVSAGLGDTAVPEFGDPEVYLNDKAALERLVGDTYDWVAALLRDLPAGRFLEDTQLFGRPMKKWRVFQVALNHADWTRGQLVPYLRLNGVEPPAWSLY